MQAEKNLASSQTTKLLNKKHMLNTSHEKSNEIFSVSYLTDVEMALLNGHFGPFFFLLFKTQHSLRQRTSRWNITNLIFANK